MKKFFFGTIAVILILAVSIILVSKNYTNNVNQANQDKKFKTFFSQVYNFGFNYPQEYFVVEDNVTTGEKYHVVQLFEDTQNNRDILSGRVNGGEGPVSISFLVVENEKKQSPTEWIQKSKISNYDAVKSKYSTTSIATIPAYSYSWDGLYHGDSVVFAHNGNIVDALVTYDSPDNKIRKDFQTIISTLTFDQKNKNISGTSSDGKVNITSPAVLEKVKSPFVVSGTAVGGWFFEASFPVKLYDGNGKLLFQGHSDAKGEWMTIGQVPFSVTVSFKAPSTSTGTLVFEKDNPSGIKMNDESFAIPVAF